MCRLKNEKNGLILRKISPFLLFLEFGAAIAAKYILKAPLLKGAVSREADWGIAKS